MKTNDKTTATPSTTNTTNGIARNPPFVALRKPLSPYFAYGILPGSSTFHSGMFASVGLGLSRVPRKGARRTLENAERRSSHNLPSTRWVDKVPVNTPNPSGWHHGCCCRTVDEERPVRMTREGYLRGTAEYHAAISYTSRTRWPRVRRWLRASSCKALTIEGSLCSASQGCRETKRLRG
jgi:hypothetical protein